MSYGPYSYELGEYVGDDFVGESNAGMQETLHGEYVGAAKALAGLRGSLGQIAQQRFARHAPISKVLRSPYKDSTQIGLNTTITVPWASGNPTAQQGTAVTRVYKSFKPNKAVVTESIDFTYTPASGGPVQHQFVSVQVPNDLLLVSAFSGADNCFPNAPSAANGINCATFSSNALGVGISWPTLNGGIDMTVGFLARPTIFGYFNSALGTLVQAVVTVDMTLLGPSLR